jgi:hypothetical protein
VSGFIAGIFFSGAVLCCALSSLLSSLVLFISGLMNETQALKKIWHKY